MSAREAQKALNDAVAYARVEHEGKALMHWFDVVPGSVTVADGELRLEIEHGRDPKKSIHLALKKLENCTLTCNRAACYIKDPAQPHALKYFYDNVLLYDDEKTDYRMVFGINLGHALCSQNGIDREACLASGERFFNAANSLRELASGRGLDPDTFHQKAAEWRVLVVKPELSQEVRVRRALAEEAIKTGKPGDALRYYEEGTALDVTWAQGWFNAALVAGQLGYYSDAALYMENYLELEPHAPDVNSARDQLAIWKYKAQQKK